MCLDRLYQDRSTTLPACDSSFALVASASNLTSSCASKLNSGPDLPRAFCGPGGALVSCESLSRDVVYCYTTHADNKVVKGVMSRDDQVFLDVDEIVDGDVAQLRPLRPDFLQELGNRITFLALATRLKGGPPTEHEQGRTYRDFFAMPAPVPVAVDYLDCTGVLSAHVEDQGPFTAAHPLLA